MMVGLMLPSLSLLSLSIFQVFAEFDRIVSKNLEGHFYEALDQITPCLIKLFKSKKGTIGQKLTDLMQHTSWMVRIRLCFSKF